MGGLGFIVDFGVFNLLRATVFDPAVVHGGSVMAKIVSTVLAILVNWLGNRYWAFKERRRADMARESFEFFFVSLLGMGIGLGVLWVSHYGLHFTSLFADNVANVIGLVLGAVFRFALYRLWVFAPGRSSAGAAATAAAAAAAKVESVGKTTSMS
ncbi:GtrA family protein [Herbiconiux sp. 11R-BC]|uniref:GtrA family protein n=1 Tax=Herbiconiux sp. 11R-BC TaxID=3111637 RepID=UPI003C01EA9B